MLFVCLFALRRCVFQARKTLGSRMRVVCLWPAQKRRVWPQISSCPEMKYYRWVAYLPNTFLTKLWSRLWMLWPFTRFTWHPPIWHVHKCSFTCSKSWLARGTLYQWWSVTYTLLLATYISSDSQWVTLYRIIKVWAYIVYNYTVKPVLYETTCL